MAETIDNPYVDAIEHYTKIKERIEESITNMHIVILRELSEHFDQLLFLRTRLRYRFRIYDYLDKNIIPAWHQKIFSRLYHRREIKQAIKEDINEINDLAERLEQYKELILKYKKLSEQFNSLRCINDEQTVDDVMSKLDNDYLAVKMHLYYR